MTRQSQVQGQTQTVRFAMRMVNEDGVTHVRFGYGGFGGTKPSWQWVRVIIHDLEVVDNDIIGSWIDPSEPMIVRTRLEHAILHAISNVFERETSMVMVWVRKDGAVEVTKAEIMHMSNPPIKVRFNRISDGCVSTEVQHHETPCTPNTIRPIDALALKLLHKLIRTAITALRVWLITSGARCIAMEIRGKEHTICASHEPLELPP